MKLIRDGDERQVESEGAEKKNQKAKRQKGKHNLQEKEEWGKENRERNELEASVLHAYVRLQLPLWLAFSI